MDIDYDPVEPVAVEMVSLPRDLVVDLLHAARRLQDYPISDPPEGPSPSMLLDHTIYRTRLALEAPHA